MWHQAKKSKVEKGFVYHLYVYTLWVNKKIDATKMYFCFVYKIDGIRNSIWFLFDREFIDINISVHLMYRGIC